MTIDLAALIAIIGLLLKTLHNLNSLDNEVIRTIVKLEYLEKHLLKLDNVIYCDLKAGDKNAS